MDEARFDKVDHQRNKVTLDVWSANVRAAVYLVLLSACSFLAAKGLVL